MLNNEEVEELRAKVDELEVTLAEVMTHGPESTVGDRATGKLMQHIQTLQEKVREGREIKAMSETMLAEQALLREQAEEAKFYMAEAEAKAKEYEELSAKLWGHLDRAGIDVEANVARPTPRQRPKFVSGLTITQGDGMLDPEVEAIQRKLLGRGPLRAHERNHDRYGARGNRRGEEGARERQGGGGGAQEEARGARRVTTPAAGACIVYVRRLSIHTVRHEMS